MGRSVPSGSIQFPSGFSCYFHKDAACTDYSDLTPLRPEVSKTTGGERLRGARITPAQGSRLKYGKPGADTLPGYEALEPQPARPVRAVLRLRGKTPGADWLTGRGGRAKAAVGSVVRARALGPDRGAGREPAPRCVVLSPAGCGGSAGGRRHCCLAADTPSLARAGPAPAREAEAGGGACAVRRGRRLAGEEAAGGGDGGEAAESDRAAVRAAAARPGLARPQDGSGAAAAGGAGRRDAGGRGGRRARARRGLPGGAAACGGGGRRR
ncbi:PREDICTED: spidroin-1-like, partial [Chinchilla lanigera]|uniref:spidroin-1-like n=1 Tax=Chinchilla lanigera TaxID=34839 RepID=UPI000695F6B9